MSWATDQIISSGRAGNPRWKDITWQWNIFSEGLARPGDHGWACHPDYCGTSASQNPGHSRGVLFKDQDLSFHHNLMPLHYSRAAKGKYEGRVDYVNNVTYGLTRGDTGVTEGSGFIQWNIVGNYFKKGPNSEYDKPFGVRPTGSQTQYYVSGNKYYDVNDKYIGDPIILLGGQTLLKSRLPFPAITTTSAEQARDQVLGDETTSHGGFGAGANARLDCEGHWVERRDAVDTRVIGHVKNGTGKVIDVPEEVGGWPSIESGIACADGDRDGMPDAFEDLYGFNKANPSDGSQDADGDGYTNVEEYLNGSTLPTSALPAKPERPTLF